MVSIPDPSDSDDDPPGGRIPPTIVASDSDEEPLATASAKNGFGDMGMSAIKDLVLHEGLKIEKKMTKEESMENV